MRLPLKRRKTHAHVSIARMLGRTLSRSSVGLDGDALSYIVALKGLGVAGYCCRGTHIATGKAFNVTLLFAP